MIQGRRKNLLLSFFVLFILSTTAVISVAAKSNAENEKTRTSADPLNTLSCPSPLKIMPAGDSITYGVGSTGTGDDLEETGGGYRKPLWNSLDGAGYSIDFVGRENEPVFTDFDDNEHEGHKGIAVKGLRDVIGFRLQNYPADVVLIHLGTNDINNNGGANAIDDLNILLDNIDIYEDSNSHVTVILAQIINRPCDLSNPVNSCDIRYNQTSALNDDIATLVQNRVNAGDDIRLVNMEDDTGLDYSATSFDFFDTIHPTNAGYAKMAAVWFNELDAYFTENCVTGNAPNITSIAVTDAIATVPYSYDVNATGDAPITYALATKPTGMSIDSGSGVISWTPTSGQVGSKNVTVTASNSAGTDTQTFTINVVDVENLFLPLVISDN